MILVAFALAAGDDPATRRGTLYSRVLSHLRASATGPREGGAMPMLLEDPPLHNRPIYDARATINVAAVRRFMAARDPPPHHDARQNLGRIQQHATAAPPLVLVLVAVLILVLIITAFYAFCAKKGRPSSNPSLSDTSPLLYDTYRIKQ
jgi:hypothetical protein